MKVIAYTKTGSKKETAVTLPAGVFGIEANNDLLNQVYNAYLSNGRSAGAKTLTRGEVRGGGKKPWKQKGTGRARAGSSRIPHWRGGGVVFGPTGNENHSVSVPTKIKRLAIRQALSVQAKDKKIIILESFDGGEGKVAATVTLFSKLGLEGQILVVVPEKTEMIIRATRNITGVATAAARYLNVFTIMNADWIVLVGDSQKLINDWLGEVDATPKITTATPVKKVDK